MSFDNIRLEKGMYGNGCSFTQMLEEADPSENYKGTSLEGLDAFQRQLKRFNIKVSGPDSSVVGKFFQTSDAAVLFPEYLTRVIRCGIDEANYLSSIVATTTNVDSMDYRAVDFKLDSDDDDNDDSREVWTSLVEGAQVPEATYTIGDRLVSLRKRGKLFSASYDAIRFQRLDVVAVALKKIGAAMAHNITADAMRTVFEGDDEDGTNAADVSEVTSFSFNNLVDFWAGFSPYKLTTLVTTPTVAATLIKMSEFRDSAAGLDFHGTGKLISPFGADLISAKGLVPEGAIVGLDKNYALEHLKVGGIEVEYGKLIDHQLEKVVITSIDGFAKIFEGASGVIATSGGEEW